MIQHNLEDTELVLKVQKESESGLFNNQRLLLIKAGYISYFSKIPKQFVGNVRSLELSGQLPKFTLCISDIQTIKVDGKNLMIKFNQKLIDRNSLGSMLQTQNQIKSTGKKQIQKKTWNFICESQSAANVASSTIGIFRKNPQFKPSLWNFIGGFKQINKGSSRQMSMLPSALKNTKYQNQQEKPIQAKKNRLSQINTSSTISKQQTVNHQAWLQSNSLPDDIVQRINKRKQQKRDQIFAVPQKAQIQQEDILENQTSQNIPRIDNQTNNKFEANQPSSNSPQFFAGTPQFVAVTPQFTVEKVNKNSSFQSMAQSWDSLIAKKNQCEIDENPNQINQNENSLKQADINKERNFLTENVQENKQLKKEESIKTLNIPLDMLRESTTASKRILDSLRVQQYVYQAPSKQQKQDNKNEYIVTEKYALGNLHGSTVKSNKTLQKLNIQQFTYSANQVNSKDQIQKYTQQKINQITQKEQTKANETTDNLKIQESQEVSNKTGSNQNTSQNKQQSSHQSQIIHQKDVNQPSTQNQNNSENQQNQQTKVLAEQNKQQKVPQLKQDQIKQSISVEPKQKNQMLELIKISEIMAKSKDLQRLFPSKNPKIEEINKQEKIESKSANLNAEIALCQQKEQLKSPNLAQEKILLNIQPPQKIAKKQPEKNIELKLPKLFQKEQKQSKKIKEPSDQKYLHEQTDLKKDKITKSEAPKFIRLSYPSQQDVQGLVSGWQTKVPSSIEKQLQQITKINIQLQQCLSEFINQIENGNNFQQNKILCINVRKYEIRIKEHLLEDNYSQLYHVFCLYEALAKKIQKSKKVASRFAIVKVIYLRYKNFEGIAIQEVKSHKIDKLQKDKLMCSGQLKYFLKTLEEDIPGLTIHMIKVHYQTSKNFLSIDQTTIPIIRTLIEIKSSAALKDISKMQGQNLINCQYKLQPLQIIKSDPKYDQIKRVTRKNLNQFIAERKLCIQSQDIDQFIQRLSRKSQTKGNIQLTKYYVSEMLGCVRQEKQWKFQGYASYAGILGRMISQSYEMFNKYLNNYKVTEAKSVLSWQISKINTENRLNHLDDFIQVCIKVCEIILCQEKFQTTISLCEKLLKTLPQYHIQRLRIFMILMSAYYKLELDSQIRICFKQANKYITQVFGQKSVASIPIYRTYALHLSKHQKTILQAQKIYLQCLQLSQQYSGSIHIDLVYFYLRNNEVSIASQHARIAYELFKNTSRQSEALLCVIKTGQLKDYKTVIKCLKVFSQRGDTNKIMDCYKIITEIIDIQDEEDYFYENEQLEEIFQLIKKAKKVCVSKVFDMFLDQQLAKLPMPVKKIAQKMLNN